MTQDYLNSTKEKSKNAIRQATIPCLGAFAALYILFAVNKHLNVSTEHTISQYRTHFRIPLFSGFLTIGSFMLSFKAFTILRLHDDVFKTPEYMERWILKAEKFKLNPNTYLDPLSRLTDTFFLTILFSLLTAFLQVTLGLLPKSWAAYICIWFALFSGMLVIRSLYVLRVNLIIWQQLLAKKYTDQLRKTLDARLLEKQRKEDDILRGIPNENSEKSHSSD